MKVFFSAALLTILILAGCRGKANDTQQQQPLVFIDTSKEFKRELPTFDDGTLDFFYVSAKEKQQQLGLDSLENGFEGLQIRLWYDSSRVLGRRLIVITNRDTSWAAQVYQMKVFYDGKKETITSVRKTQITPKSGWPIFSRKLLALPVLTLPDMYDIPGLVDNWKDGWGNSVELATKRQYRFYSYHMPEELQNQYWQAKKMVDILNLFAEEFSVAD